MTLSRLTPPLDYLQAASRTSLQSFELARLNHAANLRQEIAALIDQWITETSEAMLARWMLDHHKSQQSPQISQPDPLRTFPNPLTALLPESKSTISGIVPAPPRFSPRSASLKPSLSRKLQKEKQSATG